MPPAAARFPSSAGATASNLDPHLHAPDRLISSNLKLPAELYIVHLEMPRIFQLLLGALVLALLLAANAQQDPDLDASGRVFSEVGAGFRAIRRGPDGYYYILTEPGTAVRVFDAAGKKLRQVPAQAAAGAVLGNALDVDASGRIYVANLAANAVKIYAADGALLGQFGVPAPTGVAVLPQDEVAVCSASGNHLITIYDLRGTIVREFGELEQLADDPALNRRLNLGHLASDAAGNLYLAFQYVPEPTLRKYDPAGDLIDELSLTTLDLQPLAQFARREIARAKSGTIISPREIISTLGVDPASQEIWLALGNLLLHFDRDHNELGNNRVYTPSGARLVPNFISVEPNRLLLGNDPLGIYEFRRRSGTEPSH